MRVGSGCSEIQIARSNDLELYRGGCSIDCSFGAPYWTGLRASACSAPYRIRIACTWLH